MSSKRAKNQGHRFTNAPGSLREQLVAVESCWVLMPAFVLLTGIK